LPTLDIIKRDC